MAVPEIAVEGSQLSQLESSQRGWRRVALCSFALLALTMIGWAPISNKGTSDVPDDITGELLPELTGPAESEGDLPYNPTRLEWLYLRASATLHLDAWDKDGFAITFAAGGRGSNAVTIVVTYDPKRVDREKMNKEIDFARETLRTMATNSGWGGWFLVKEKLIAVGGSPNK